MEMGCGMNHSKDNDYNLTDKNVNGELPVVITGRSNLTVHC